MSGTVSFHDVWKSFRRGQRNDSLRDLIPALARRLVASPARPTTNPAAFWAVREVSFEVRPGQALGVIGPNGSGKSTLLKLAAGILRAERGQVDVRGRIGALIELVAAFHSELTGRENVYLQGAVMGMKRAEIDRKLEQIVEFSGVGPFLDTPLKRYSSGMSARLGFSVAAHLDADVLLIDEVLAVGDAAFQRKAFDRLQEILAGDVAVVLVSHQLDRVSQLCDRAILMTEGRVVTSGTAGECVAAYVGESGDGVVASGCPVTIEGISNAEPSRVSCGERIRLTIGGCVEDPAAAEEAAVGVRVRAVGPERLLFAAHSKASGLALPPGRFTLEVDLTMNVPPGSYRVQPVVWHAGRGLEWARAPSALVRVTPGGEWFGNAFLSPRLRLLAGEAREGAAARHE